MGEAIIALSDIIRLFDNIQQLLTLKEKASPLKVRSCILKEINNLSASIKKYFLNNATIFYKDNFPTLSA